MIRTGIALIKFYAAHPSVALKHARIATHVLVSDGAQRLVDLIRAKSWEMRTQLDRLRADQEVRTRLARLPLAQKTNYETLIEALLPYAGDLSVLDVVHNMEEQLRLIHRHILKKYQLLDGEFYARKYLEGVTTIHPTDHYMQFGLPNGLQPNPFFDPLAYSSANPDVTDWGMDPVIHYALFGWREGRSAGSLFDGDYYLSTNPDVAESGMSPLIHFLQTGRHERRAPRPGDAGAEGIGELPRTNGTIILVSHDAELGGAQQVVRVFANWLLAATRYDIKLVTMRGGALAHSFAEIAPTLDISALPADNVAERLRTFAGGDVKAVFINSVASGSFLKHWNEDTPIVAFIHELPKVLKLYEENLALLKKRAHTIIGGSGAVQQALRDKFGIEEERLRTVYGFIETLAPDHLVSFDGKRAAKKDLGIDPDTFVITACGVLHWRKSPDKFIAVAEKIAAERGCKAQFVWIGGGSDQAKCERLVAQKNLAHIVRFTGYESDIMRWLNASDLFLLPSEEDPFPLACLYAAMALNPIVCFKESGGMPELTSRGCGRAVDFGDVDAMASAALDYMADDELRRRDGIAGRALVETEHTVATTGPQLFHHIREAAELLPQLSVIVPNYNYERFLGERLQTIADQSFQDFEVVLLDDNSSDKSVDILKKWAAKRPGTQLVVNEVNSGSPFAQWMRGMRLAQSNLIWIAEADDACHSDFLKSMLPYFDDRNVLLGHAKSVPVDETGVELGNYETLYLNRIADNRWSRSFVATDHEEANEGLGIANCIPNASSVLLRRFEPEPEFETAITGMRMCGDWLFYLRAMRGGLVAYHEKPLNFHRRHGATVTQRTEGSKRYFDEFATVRDYVARTYRLGEEARSKIEHFTLHDLDRFDIAEVDERKAIRAQTQRFDTPTAMPSILVVVSDLSPGGGQMFGIALANAWTRRGGRAVLLNVRHFPDHEQVVARIDARVPVYHADADEVSVQELVQRYDIDVVHSSLWWADRHVYDSIDDLPWVISMHGCYETLLDYPEIDISFEGRIQQMLKRVDMWIPTAQKNRRVFSVYGPPKREKAILNGIEIESANPLSRAELGLREDAVVLCLATRAIAEKGWLEAIEMVERLNAAGHPVDLMLIGEGPAVEAVSARKAAHVHLYGHMANLQDYIAAADIGLLPSFFVGESMPLVLLDMMARGKPVVATDVGEIATMVGEGKEAGGVVVPLVKGKVDVSGFVEAIVSLLDATTRRNIGNQARKRFESGYTMDGMIAAYGGIYRQLVAEHHRNLTSAGDEALGAAAPVEERTGRTIR